jgi:hypothetical protein
MVPHAVRLIVIAVCFVAALAALVVLIALGKASGEGFVAVLTMLGIFGPALLDAETVRRKRAKTENDASSAP